MMIRAINTIEAMWDLLGDVGAEVYSRDFDEEFVVMQWENTLTLISEIETRIRYEEELLHSDC